MSAEELRAAARGLRVDAESIGETPLALGRMFESLADWIDEEERLCHSWARYDHVHDAITVARTYLRETA